MALCCVYEWTSSTLAPSIRKESLNLALAFAAEQDVAIEVIAIETAFIYTQSQEIKYMDESNKLMDERQEVRVMQALYGTNQVARE
ncbi:hypothetical protein KXD40_009432 [Peronospora effusa]|uniref:Uncharacterized protein n=1 Tax=Peronospora effusa TaxID=542832 RepID=A0A3M6VQS0_9STRA|nr:hypothetical protein DD238_007372 [Peronospora effusa]RQM10353.1 hypothetical protein DD237_007314 [Peronospora effusa]UIZ28546.1 hypothetical protein KXD40_009432 [Peronospora effusa]CAI5702621.1 unnamed protein product [Peronospora effusa]